MTRDYQHGIASHMLFASAVSTGCFAHPPVAWLTMPSLGTKTAIVMCAQMLRLCTLISRRTS